MEADNDILAVIFHIKMIQSVHKVRGSIMHVAELRSTNTQAKTEESRKKAESFRKEVESEWFSQSLRRVQFGSEKKHKLFEEKEVKTGVFGNKTLAEAAGFNSDYDVDWETEGTDKLTEEQIQELEGKYDLENMTEEDYRKLMRDLMNMKIIAQAEAERKCLYTKTGIEGVLLGKES